MRGTLIIKWLRLTSDNHRHIKYTNPALCLFKSRRDTSDLYYFGDVWLGSPVPWRRPDVSCPGCRMGDCLTMTPAYREYLLSPEWRRVSAAVIARAGGRCQTCNGTETLQAHHRTYAVLGNEMENLGDLTCLCKRCHSYFHRYIATRKPRKRRARKPARTKPRSSTRDLPF